MLQLTRIHSAPFDLEPCRSRKQFSRMIHAFLILVTHYMSRLLLKRVAWLVGIGEQKRNW